MDSFIVTTLLLSQHKRKRERKFNQRTMADGQNEGPDSPPGRCKTRGQIEETRNEAPKK